METIERKVSRRRSPSYPVINLKEAIDKVVILWKKDQTNPIPREAAFKHLGYEGGGYAGRVIAALRQFDLISEKRGDIVLTTNAVDLALHKPSDDKYKEIVKKIALKPTIYKTIYNEYQGQLPSDETLRIRLIKGYLFNVGKVTKFLSDFRSTISFAGLSGIEEKIEGDEDKNIEEESGGIINLAGTFSAKSSSSGTLSVSRKYSLPGGITIVFEDFPTKEETLDKLKQWIDLFKDELIGTDNENKQ